MTPAGTNQHFFSPHNVGEVERPDASGQSGSLTCGAVIRVTLQIDEQKIITAAKFKAAGCSALVAASSFLTDDVKGRTTAEAAERARNLTSLTAEAFGEPSEDREHCAAIASEALLTSIRNYSDSRRAEWAGEDALICACFGVSDHTIENAIRDRQLSSTEEVADVCGAGAGCGSCVPLVQEIIEGMGLAELAVARFLTTEPQRRARETEKSKNGE